MAGLLTGGLLSGQVVGFPEWAWWTPMNCPDPPQKRTCCPRFWECWQQIAFSIQPLRDCVTCRETPPQATLPAAVAHLHHSWVNVKADCLQQWYQLSLILEASFRSSPTWYPVTQHPELEIGRGVGFIPWMLTNTNKSELLFFQRQFASTPLFLLTQGSLEAFEGSLCSRSSGVGWYGCWTS